jgi:hypothetical protein
MSNTLKFGNGTWATKKGSTLAYNDENNNYKPLPFTTTRNSIATRVNKEGLIEVVGNDIPRIDYTDSADGTLLLEPSRTNAATYSEAFDNSFWIKDNATVVGGYSAPDGSNNAFKLIEGTSNSQHNVRSSFIPTTNGSEIAASVFVKADTRSEVVMQEAAYTGVYLSVDLISETITTNGTSANLTKLVNGWFRIDIISTCNVVTAWKVMPSLNGTSTYQGDGTSGIYIWGFQLEDVASYATSYIPTNGSSVTRVADTANGAGNSQVFNDSQGVLFFNLNTLNTSSVPVFSLSDGTFSNEIEFAYYGTNQWNVISRVGGANTSVVGTVNGDAYSKFSVSYTSSNFKVFLNGFLIGSNTMASAFSGLKKINFSYPDEANPFQGKTKEIGYYDTALTDEELEYMTSYRSLNELVTELNLNEL